MRKFKLSLVLASMLTSSCLVADDNVNLDTIEVNAESIGYSNIDSLKISSKNAGAIRDVMRDIPGVYVAGTNQINQKLYMRGVNDRGINITVDGARQRGNVFHHSADLILDVDLLKAINIGVGVLSVANNSGALGGSVAFKTVNAFDLLEDGENFGAKFKTGYASNNKEWQKSLMAYGKANDNFGVLAYVNHKNYSFGKDGNGNDIGGKGDDLSYLIKASFLNDDNKLNLAAEHTEYKGKFPFRGEFAGAVAVATDVFDNKKNFLYTLKPGERNQDVFTQKMNRDTYTLTYNYNPNELVDLNFDTYYTEHKLKWKPKADEWGRADKDGVYTKSYFDGGVKTFGVYLNNKSIFKTAELEHSLKYGYEFYNSTSFVKNSYKEKKDSTGAITPVNHTIMPDDKAYNHSFYLEDTIRLGGLSVIPGVRFDYFKLDTFNTKDKRISYSYNNVSPALAIDYKFDMGLNLFAGYSKVFRGPDPVEALRLREDVGAKLVSPENLKAESGHAKEIGFGYKNSFNEHNVNFIAKYYHTDYKNLIKEATTQSGKKPSKENPETQFVRLNTGKAKVYGVELLAKYSYENFSTGISYTNQKTKYADKNAIKGGVLAYSDSGDKYTFNAEYFIDAIDLNAGYNLIYFASKKMDNQDFVKPAYAVSDIYFNYYPSFAKNLEINLSVSNLFDKTYVSHSQRIFGKETTNDYEAGRNIKLGFSYKF